MTKYFDLFCRYTFGLKRPRLYPVCNAFKIKQVLKPEKAAYTAILIGIDDTKEMRNKFIEAGVTDFDYVYPADICERGIKNAWGFNVNYHTEVQPHEIVDWCATQGRKGLKEIWKKLEELSLEKDKAMKRWMKDLEMFAQMIGGESIPSGALCDHMLHSAGRYMAQGIKNPISEDPYYYRYYDCMELFYIDEEENENETD